MNKLDLRRFAPYGLILAAIALLVSGALYIILRSFDLPLQISLALVVIGLALFVLLDPQRAKEALTGRQARYGSNALVLSIAFIGILVVINYVANQNSVRWDLTEDQQNTLAPETLGSLESLTEPVFAEAYYTSRYPLGTTGEILENYKLNSRGKFDYEIIDPEAEPVRAQAANITRDGTVVLRQGDRMEQLTFVSEQELTAAMIRLANPGQRSIYFLVGHGEYDITGAGENAYPDLDTVLSAKNYTINTLNLLANPVIPEDTLAIVVAGPTKPLSGDEVSAIQEYLAQGGSLVYLAEPRLLTEFGDAPDPMAAYLEQFWGIRLAEDVIIDLNNQQQPLIAIANQFGNHAITQKMATLGVLFPTARSVQLMEVPDGVTVSELAFTTEMAWGETDMASIEAQEVTADEGTDHIGPVNIAAAGVNNTTQARVLVIGDADFANNNYFQYYGNGDFITNAIDWAAEQENLISLTPKQQTQRLLIIPDRTTMGLILFGSIFLLPGIILITGLFVWIQRRRRM